MTNIERIKARFWELLPSSLDDYSQALDKLLDLVGELSVERLVRFVNNMNDYDTQLLAVADDGDECPICKCGTVEVVDGEVRCKGECGNTALKMAFSVTMPPQGDPIYPPFRCPECGSKDVWVDGIAPWMFETERGGDVDLHSVTERDCVFFYQFMDAHCQSCDHEGKAVDFSVESYEEGHHKE